MRHCCQTRIPIVQCLFDTTLSLFWWMERRPLVVPLLAVGLGGGGFGVEGCVVGEKTVRVTDRSIV